MSDRIYFSPNINKAKTVFDESTTMFSVTVGAIYVYGGENADKIPVSGNLTISSPYQTGLTENNMLYRQKYAFQAIEPLFFTDETPEYDVDMTTNFVSDVDYQPNITVFEAIQQWEHIGVSDVHIENMRDSDIKVEWSVIEQGYDVTNIARSLWSLLQSDESMVQNSAGFIFKKFSPLLSQEVTMIVEPSETLDANILVHCPGDVSVIGVADCGEDIVFTYSKGTKTVEVNMNIFEGITRLSNLEIGLGFEQFLMKNIANAMYSVRKEQKEITE